MPDIRHVEFNVNGEDYSLDVETRLTLADCLRHKIGKTGTHLGCEHGVCGACTILVDGASTRSCLMLAVQAHGKKIITIEGIASEEGMWHPLQQAFHEHHALQCGYCTAGIITSMVEFLSENADPTEENIREALSGNICRCTGYQGMVRAVLSAAKKLRSSQKGLTL